MIIFKWYDAYKKGNKKEVDFTLEKEDVMSLISSIVGYTENIGKSIDSVLDLDEYEKEKVKRLMQSAFKLGIKKAFGE